MHIDTHYGASVVSLSSSWSLRRDGDGKEEREELSLGQAKPLPPPLRHRHLAAATSPSQRFEISNSNFKSTFIYKRL